MAFEPAQRPGILHHFTSRLVAFEHVPSEADRARPQACNFILFVGGLGDGLLTVRYTAKLAYQLPPHWSIAEVLLSSAYPGWTTSNLTKDADELARCVAYFRNLARSRQQGSSSGNTAASSNIVLMGHSTGANVSMEYLVGPRLAPSIPSATLARAPVQGVILQGGISDREGVTHALGEEAIAAGLSLARDWIRDGKGEEILPMHASKGVFLHSPTAQRWVSLVGGAPGTDEQDMVQGEGADDYFSSDMPASDLQRIYGAGGLAKRGARVLVLMGAEDEFLPPQVQGSALVDMWRNEIVGAGGQWDDDAGVLEGATHSLNKSDESAVQGLCGRVVRFLARVEQGTKGDDAAGSGKL